MLTKYKDDRPKKPFEKCFHDWGEFRHFFREGTPTFHIPSGVVFFGKIILKHIKNKKRLSEVREHAPPENF